MEPVVVAGAGPVGLVAALVLARRDIPVVVLEAGDGLAAESRASTFHPPTLEMLTELGVYDDVHERGLVTSRFAYRDRQTGPIATLDLGVLRDDTPYPFRIQLEQSKLTPILLDLLGTMANVDVRFNARVTDAVVESAGVTVATARGEVRCGWLIGADGAHSSVRRALGIAFNGITYPERFLVLSTPEDLPAHLPQLESINYVFDPDEWLVLLQTPDHWRILLPTAEGTPDDAETATGTVQSRLRGVADIGRDWELLAASLYRVHQRVAATFLAGRALLVGDAAHVNNPLGGFGMNSGIHDAVLIGTALADVLTAGASPNVIAAIAAARRDVSLEFTQQSSHRNWERMRERDRGAREAVHAELRALAADPVAMREHLLRSSMISSLRRQRA